MRSQRYIPWMATLVALAACGVPIQSGQHFTGSWAPERQTTFAWQDSRDITVGDTRLAASRFFHERLHEAVEWELSLRGIRYASTDPELTIHHHLSLADHVLENEVLDEGGQRVIETDVYEGGSLVLHIVDARTGEDVWVAWGAANVEPAFANPESIRRWVYRLVGEMFSDWAIAPR